jgi:hypothetical protein
MSLPPALERELQCPAAGAPNHFAPQPGAAGWACTDDDAARWRALPVADGQIIVNEHPGARSLLLSLAATRFSPYIHIGIVAIEDGEPQVYEAFGNFIPLPWPGGKHYMGGGVRRVTLRAFLSRGGIAALHEPGAGVDRGLLVRFAREALRRRVPFDGGYDPLDPSRYYCAEFVARALQAAGGKPVPMVPTSRNPSMRVALQWLGVRATSLQLAGDVVAGMPRVALISPGYSEADVERYFALKHELHRRFTDDQALGNLFIWERRALRLRPSLERFTDESLGAKEAPRVLADRILGALPAATPLADSR